MSEDDVSATAPGLISNKRQRPEISASGMRRPRPTRPLDALPCSPTCGTSFQHDGEHVVTARHAAVPSGPAAATPEQAPWWPAQRNRGLQTGLVSEAESRPPAAKSPCLAELACCDAPMYTASAQSPSAARPRALSLRNLPSPSSPAGPPRPPVTA